MSGPIPARAGEPRATACCTSQARAYPRSRGGTCGRWHLIAVRQGLSPLARGNHHQNRNPHQWQGPIPARAGEPFGRNRCRANRGAYPRSRGGTGLALRCSRLYCGLSPLARGNPGRRNLQRGHHRPIPARAGEPLNWQIIGHVCKAYPRSRGGTAKKKSGSRRFSGLSPLARGNQCRHHA